MKTDNSDWLKHRFDAISLEVTPASGRPVATVLYAPLSSDFDVSSRCAALVLHSPA
jgi:hypothetical protein